MAVSQYPYQTCLASCELRRRKIICADKSDLCLFSTVSYCGEIYCGPQHLRDWQLAALMISGGNDDWDNFKQCPTWHRIDVCSHEGPLCLPLAKGVI